MTVEEELGKSAEPLLKLGYVAIGDGYNMFSGTYWIRLMHKETFALVVLEEEVVDDEEFFNAAFGIDDEEAEERLREELGLPSVMHAKDAELLKTKFFDWEDKDFKAMIQTLIAQNEVKIT